jgi:hypothetical protein
VNSFKSALLASSVLTTVGFGALAGTFTEVTDFPNNPPGTNIDFGTFQSVQGTLAGTSDPADYFTFTGLTAGDDFSITFNRLVGCTTCASPFTFTADLLSPVTLVPPQSVTETGVLSATSLTVGVTDTNTSSSGSAEGYSVTLSEVPAGIPEPSAAALFAVGLAGLAVARRRRGRYH